MSKVAAYGRRNERSNEIFLVVDTEGSKERMIAPNGADRLLRPDRFGPAEFVELDLLPEPQKKKFFALDRELNLDGARIAALENAEEAEFRFLMQNPGVQFMKAASFGRRTESLEGRKDLLYRVGDSIMKYGCADQLEFIQAQRALRDAIREGFNRNSPHAWE